MKKTKPRKVKTSMPKTLPVAAPLSKHPIAAHADKIRGLVHNYLRDNNISDLSLHSMQFSATDSCSDPCPDPTQHRQMVCHTYPGDKQVCSCECVS